MTETIFMDEDIQREVLDELLWDPAVEASEIGVTVDAGVVTLTGTVETYSMSSAAEAAAHRVRGVKAVANNIQVTPPSDRTRTDTDIAKAAANALEWNARVPHQQIKTTVRDGWVTLEGHVRWHYQKVAAYKSVRDLMGVRGVSDLITVAAPSASAEEIKSKIEDSLTRSALLDVERIQVDVRDGKVILKGSVDSWVERDKAEKTAWAAPGVTDVENQIAVSS
ncbi:MAG: BON domain-containing protein [Chloroflexota bacterium]|nr:MAG: BON domain-containing protein [Chloroflexota bacterium]